MIRTGLSLAGAVLVLAAGAHAAGRPVVVIDPGHDRLANAETEAIGPGSATRKIKDGGGTSGVVTRIREADLVLDVSLRLRTLLRRAGVTVVTTRTRTTGKSMGNIARARIASRARAALFVRVHADGHPDSSVRGTHTLVPAFRSGWTDDVHRASRRAALAVQRELVPALGFPDRGIQERSDFTGFNWADVPVILVELGFMTNAVEDRLLARPAVRQRAALGLCRGTLAFLGLRPARCRIWGDYPLTVGTYSDRVWSWQEVRARRRPTATRFLTFKRSFRPTTLALIGSGVTFTARTAARLNAQSVTGSGASTA